MSVLRKRLDVSFTVVPNELLDDELLDLTAKGLVCYMLAKPDGWRFSAERMSRTMPEGRDAIRGALSRAEAAGWVQRRDIRKEDGTFTRIVTVRNNRLLDWDSDGPTDGGQTDLGLTEVGSTVAVSKDLEASTELARTEISTLAPRKRDALWDAFVEVLGLEGKPTKPERKSLNTAVSNVRDAWAGVDELPYDEVLAEMQRRAENYDRRYPHAALTAQALARHWSECKNAPMKRNGDERTDRIVEDIFR